MFFCSCNNSNASFGQDQGIYQHRWGRNSILKFHPEVFPSQNSDFGFLRVSISCLDGRRASLFAIISLTMVIHHHQPLLTSFQSFLPRTFGEAQQGYEDGMSLGQLEDELAAVGLTVSEHGELSPPSMEAWRTGVESKEL